MKLNVVALATACGVLWGVCILFVGVVSWFSEGYGRSFQEIIGGLYPFYAGNGETVDLLIGTIVGVVDGSVGGALLALIYNGCCRCCGRDRSA